MNQRGGAGKLSDVVVVVVAAAAAPAAALTSRMAGGPESVATQSKMSM